MLCPPDCGLTVWCASSNEGRRRSRVEAVLSSLHIAAHGGLLALLSVLHRWPLPQRPGTLMSCGPGLEELPLQGMFTYVTTSSSPKITGFRTFIPLLCMRSSRCLDSRVLLWLCLLGSVQPQFKVEGPGSQAVLPCEAHSRMRTA